MKNILLPAKSSNRIPINLYSVSAAVCLLSAIAVFFAGCKKEEQQEPETFISNIAAPTWAAPEETDMTSSMTAVVKVDLKAQYPDKAADFVLDDNDLLAAFAGETCLGVASPQDGLFFQYITCPPSVSEAVCQRSGLSSDSEAVTLRYYSAHYKNLFIAADAVPYSNDSRLGTVAEPLTPHFVVTR